MEPLTIHLLGSPQVTVGRQSLSFPTRKVLALLVYLVVEGGRPSRETLMALLWPESAPDKAALTLRGALSRLRKTLQPAGECILTEGTSVAFDFEKAPDLDLTWLAAAARPEMPPIELGTILAMDRGEFLEGFTLPDAPGFDNWTTIRREVIQRQLETVYDRLSQDLLARRNGASAEETAARWAPHGRPGLERSASRCLADAPTIAGHATAGTRDGAKPGDGYIGRPYRPGPHWRKLPWIIGHGELNTNGDPWPAAAPALGWPF